MTTVIQTHAPQHEAFLSPQAAAAFLGGVNARTLVRWAREGTVPAFTIGEGARRLWRFRAADLTSWLESRRDCVAVVQKTDCKVAPQRCHVRAIGGKR